MTRSSRDRDNALYEYLLNLNFTREEIDKSSFPVSEREERCQRCAFDFSEGWAQAQKWEVSEAQRQGIAVQAMVGLLSADGRDGSFESGESLAIAAYRMADSMIAAAKKEITGMDGKMTP